MNLAHACQGEGLQALEQGNVHPAGGRITNMDLTAATVASAAADYPDVQPLSAVEEDHVEMLPEMFESGEFGRRDPEWVVQWYFRRFLGAYPDEKRRVAEDAYAENTYEDVLDAIGGAREAGDARAKLGCLTALEGVDVSVGSAFLQFLHPDRYLVCSEREWETLRAAGKIDAAYPDPPSVDDYETYLATCQSVADRCDCSLLTLYRALWTIGHRRADGATRTG